MTGLVNDGKSYGSGPQIGGGPAPIQQPQQPDIYSRYGGQQNVDSDPNLDGYQPPTGNLMQPQVDPGMPGGKSGFGPGPQIGGGPAPLDPNMPNPLGPEGQQPVTPQPPAGTPGGKSTDGFVGLGNNQPAITQQQFENFASQLFRQ